MEKLAKRNTNVDIMRTFLILFIIMHHCIINGYGLQTTLKTGLLFDNGKLTDQGGYGIIWGCINAFAIIGVNCFFLISGYYQIHCTRRKMFILMFDLYMYTDAMILLSIVLGQETLNLVTIRNFLFPFAKHWFIGVYLLLSLSSIFLNKGINSLSKRQDTVILFISTFLFCFLGFVCSMSYLGLENGYSITFAVYLYYLGTLIGKYNLGKKSISIYFAGWVGSSIVTGLLASLMIFFNKGVLAWKMFSYNQPFVILASICFIIFFLKAPQEKNVIKKIPWSEFAKHILPIYYIHTSLPFSYYRSIPQKWLINNVCWSIQFIFLIIYAIFIFCVCLFTDCLLQALIGNLKKKIISKAERWLDKILEVCINCF